MKFPLRPVGVLLVAGGVAFAAGCSGCGQTATYDPTAPTGTAAASANPWPRFVSTVRNNPGPKELRAAVAELNAGLVNAPPAERPKAADPAAVEAIGNALQLTPAEQKYLAGGEYTALDANHLSECLYLSDVIAGLGVTTADPPAARADAAFRFVTRQVVLAPATLRNSYLPPVPPTFVLTRGWGSGLERAFTFIALCRQLDLDAYLIGPPTAAGQGWTFRGPRPQDQPPKGPFWAVGVASPAGVLLFDPWRGEPVPGKTAGRPVSLVELKADPTACPWTADKARPWDVTRDDIQAAGLFVSPPLPALTLRMARLQEKLKDAVGARLAIDWATASAGGATAWNPKDDRFTPVRALGAFLPFEQGGLDSTPETSLNSMYQQYTLARLPIDRVLRAPLGVVNEQARQTLGGMAAEAFRTAFLAAPTPREQLQRGQYNAAVENLVKRRDEFNKLLALPEGSDLAEWYAGLNAVYNRLATAQGTANEPAAKAEVDKFLRAGGRSLSRVIGGMVAEAGVGEATYLLALATHEQAEAAEAAAGKDSPEARKAAKEQWAKAAIGWRQYAKHAIAQDISFPGRKAAAEAMAARAEKLKQ
ncbi:MAG: hypothetical protein MUF18_17760 [Fimbriiglobus sp.]|nr:hypothetical protein [Fimbriiglobus sp.]